MTLLFIGYHSPYFPTITEYIEKAIEKQGVSIHSVDDRRHVIPGPFRSAFPLLDRLDRHMINFRLVQIGRRLKPDIALISGGFRILPDTIRKLKRSGTITALWTTDAPIQFRPILESAKAYDHVFCQGTEAITLLSPLGVDAKWLPMACDPDHHYPVTLSASERRFYATELAFVGSYYPNRAELLERLTDFNLGVWGPGWHQLTAASPLNACIRGAHTPPDVWRRIYSGSQIVLAVHYRDPDNRVPVYQASPRIFEAMACGATVLSDDQRDVFDLFEADRDLIRFSHADELAEKANYYLNDPAACRRIARNGRATVLERHTYAHRIQTLLAMVTS